jgi:hypothetical protein
MRNLAVLIVPLLCSAAGAPTAIESAIDMARAAPGEFAADAMIRIAALDQVEKGRKLSLLEEAFRRAAESQEPYRRRAGITKVAGSAGFLNRAFDQDLDTLTLRLRVVEAMLPLDKAKARDLFLQIPPVQLPKLKCSDFLVYDVSRFYEVLGRMAREGFTAKQIEEGEPLHLLLQHAAAISSPAQVIPMARTITQAKFKDDDFQTLVAAYAGALGRISGDDRSFTYAHSTGPAILALVDELKSRKMSPLPLLENYRLYLVANLTAARCADADLMLNVPQSFALANGAPTVITDAAGYFNQALRIPPLQLIEDAEIVPAKVEGAAEGLRSCEDADCQAVARQYRSLVFQPGGAAFSVAERKETEWQARLQDFLSAMTAWKESSAAAPAPYFRNKCGIYSELMGLVPTPENREKVIRALLDFVERSTFQAESRVQWFLPVNALLGRAGLDPLELGKLLPEFRQSADPIIALYAHLETIAPRGPERIMPLL